MPGGGGIRFARYAHTKRFAKDFAKLDPVIQARAEARLRDLLADLRPAGMRFEKLHGYRNPDVYSFHVTGNFKVSLHCVTSEEDGALVAVLRRIAAHDEIDRAP